MGFALWTLLMAACAVSQGADSVSTAAQAKSSRQLIRRTSSFQDRSSRLSARWIGQDGHDYVGPSERPAPSDIQDIHIALAGLDPSHEVVFVEVKSTNGNFWRFDDKPGAWRAEFKRAKGSRTGDVFFEPAWVETGRPFHVQVRYDDGSTAETDLRGGKADDKLRVTTVALAARWIGQDRHDRTGAGPSVGPDGLQDVRIHLSRLSTKLTLNAIRVAATGGASWESGPNHKLLSTAELVRDPNDPSQADLFFQPTRDMSGERLKLTAVYQNEQLDSTTIAAARCDPKLRMPASPLPKVSNLAATARWLGQDGSGGRGDVHVAISGMPAAPAIAAAVLADSQRGAWIYRPTDRAPVAADPYTPSFTIKPNARSKSIDVFFPPYRDESTSLMTLRLVSADGRSSIIHFPGGSCDPAKRSLMPEATSATGKPGDDIQSLVDRFGSVALEPGTYRLARPLVLNRPVSLSAKPGSTISFSQPAGDAPWSSAIKIHCGNTTLSGFSVRFEGPIRWKNDVDYGPAVIGMTDNFDQGHDDPRCNVVLKHLDLESPASENPSAWVDALRLMRLNRAKSGVIADNVLRGGMIEFFDGPWHITGNQFHGTPPGTISHAVFAGHGTHDLIVRSNVTRSVGPSGKTWRFLVLTWFGSDDVVEGNTIEQIGARDDDTIPWNNEPEIILTEAYHLKYEGSVVSLSSNGRVLRTGPLQGDGVRTGDVVSILNGPAAGQWRRVVQAIDPTAFLVDAAIPPGTEVVSISTGFVGETFQQNRIDVRGGRRSTPLVLPGNHFGTRVIKNHFLGGEFAFSLLAFATETPVVWGWSHVPFMGGVIEGNILEDAEKGGILGVSHDGTHTKTNQGRVYMTATLSDNVVRWSDSFLSKVAAGSKDTPPGITVGYAPSHDAGEFILSAHRNRLEAPAAAASSHPLVIPAATYNGKRLLNRKLSLTDDAADARPPSRAASKKSSSRAQ